MSNWDLKEFNTHLLRWEERRQALREQSQKLRASNLPLKFLRQQSHFTTPASNYDMVLKAVEKGSSATRKILEKFDISTTQLAETLDISTAFLERELQRDPGAPLVMVDGEDAQALRDDVVERGRANAIRIFKEANWGKTLRFYRPSGLNLDYSLKDILIVLTESAKGLPPEKFPIDGIIWPKAEHPEEIALIVEILGEIEHNLGLAENSIKMQFLVESGYGAAQLPSLVKAAIGRLAGLVWGIADYSADIGLPEIENGHPVCDWVRSNIINMAGAANVPAIDNMTVNYPVPNKDLSLAENRKLILDRTREVYLDAVHGRDLGMDGKWVGHPLQLFAVKLAYRLGLTEEDVKAEVDKIDAYTQAVDAEQGATIIKGVMSDRATDRHARLKLRKAVALGMLDAHKGVELGIVTQQEADELKQG